MIVRDYIFEIDLDPVLKDGRTTIYIPQILFGGEVVWTSDEFASTDRKVAQAAAEDRLRQMMKIVFNPEEFQRARPAILF